MLHDLRLFYSEFRQNFATTGAIVPSSPSLCRAMTRPLRQRTSSAIRILEVGAGTGAFTQQILRHLRRGDQFDIYEVNPRFYSFLKQSLPWEHCAAQRIQCRLYNSDVRKLRPGLAYDYIVCGLPFNNFDPQTASEIFNVLMNQLSPTGVLSYFEYILSHEFKAKFLKPAERERLLQVGVTVRSFIEKHQYGSHQVWLNLPPAKVRYCRKAASQLYRIRERPA
jgi:phosphatidylethanolamine/phosphatidyl-N-methylethanolamine N-methyltransferase